MNTLRRSSNAQAKKFVPRLNRHITVLKNGAQSFTDLQTGRDMTVALETLAPKDSVVVADTGGTLTSTTTNDVRIVMVEPESVPIALGIPDFDLRFGAALRAPPAAEKEPDRRCVLAAIKEAALQADQWQQQSYHDLSEAQTLHGRVPVLFCVIAYNAGNRDFEGAIGFNDRLAPNVQFDKLLSTHKVVDASMAKALLSFVPNLAIVAADIDRFLHVAGTAVQAQASFVRTTGVLHHQIASTKLSPGEGGNPLRNHTAAAQG